MVHLPTFTYIYLHLAEKSTRCKGEDTIHGSYGYGILDSGMGNIILSFGSLYQCSGRLGCTAVSILQMRKPLLHRWLMFFRNFNHEIITQLRIKPHSNHLYTSTAKNQSSATSHEDLVFNMSAFTIALEHKIALIWAWPVSNTNSNRSSSTLTPYLIGFSETPTVTRASRSLKSPQ